MSLDLPYGGKFWGCFIDCVRHSFLLQAHGQGESPDTGAWSLISTTDGRCTSWIPTDNGHLQVPDSIFDHDARMLGVYV